MPLKGIDIQLRFFAWIGRLPPLLLQTSLSAPHSLFAKLMFCLTFLRRRGQKRTCWQVRSGKRWGLSNSVSASKKGVKVHNPGCRESAEKSWMWPRVAKKHHVTADDRQLVWVRILSEILSADAKPAHFYTHNKQISLPSLIWKIFKKILGLLKVLKLRFSVASQVNGGSDVEARLSGQNYLHLSNMAPQFCLFLPGVCRLLKSAD